MAFNAADTQTGVHQTQELDALVIGAGLGGMYSLHSLREMGLSVRIFDGAPRVGGT